MIFLKTETVGVRKLLFKAMLRHQQEKNKISTNMIKEINYKIFDWALIKSIYLVLISYFKNIINIFNKKPFYNFNIANVEIGKFVTRTTLRNTLTNLSFLKFLFYFHKNLIKAIFIFASCLRISKTVKTIILVRDSYYLDGILLDFFLPKKGVKIYTKDPNGLICIKRNFYNLSDFFKNLFTQSRQKVLNYKNINKYMKNRLTNPTKTIFYYQSDNNDKILTINRNRNKKKKNLIIYTHSFTDAQMPFGFTGFKSVLDWLVYTLNIVSKFSNINIYLKVHPCMFNSSSNSIIKTMDQHIWHNIKNKIPKNIKIIENTITNNDFLDFFPKDNTVLISHHGNAIIEGSYLGFRTISSYASPWFDNYTFSNVWYNKQEYLSLLKKACTSINKLSESDDSVFRFIQDRYLANYGLYSDKSYLEIISKFLKISLKKVINKHNDINISKERENFLVKSLSRSISEF